MAAGIDSALIQLGAATIASNIAYIQLHSAVPSGAGSSECTSARQAVTCTSAGGVVTIPQTAFTGVAASGPVVALGYWSAATAGVFYGYNLLAGDQTANAAGQYTVNVSTITGSAS